MSLNHNLNSDIREALSQMELQDENEKNKTLRLLIEKYIHLNTTSMLFDKYDFMMIRDHALREFKDKNFPKKFKKNRTKGNAEISTQEAPNFCLVLATIGYLKSKGCLKKMPVFNLEEEL